MQEQLIAPAPTLRYRRRLKLIASLRELWRARDLIRTLAERDLRVRYKQAVLGFAWAIVTPLVMMVVFNLLIRRVITVDTGGIPYPIFAYLGLLPWGFFSSSVSHGGTSLVGNASLLNKIHCPREVFPIATMIVAAVETAISALILVLLFLWTDVSPKSTTMWVPVLLIIQVAFTLGIMLSVSSLVVYLRDLRHALPILIQLGLFASPVAYGIEVVPANLRWLYSLLNPLAPIIDGYRRTVLLGKPPQWEFLLLGAITSLLVVIGGYAIFKRLETGFADVA